MLSNTSYQKIILVTGCSSGLGLALANRLYKDLNYKVIVTTRSGSFETLKKTFLESERFILRKIDVTQNEDIEELINEVSVLWGGVDVLINNAGICYRSVIEHMDEDSELQQLKTNYLGPMSIIRSILPLMREKGSGHIINISSVSGILSMPTMGSYSASKQALEAATEALWYEVKPFGIKVSIVQPGFINSPSYKRIQYSPKAILSDELHGPYSEFYSHFRPFIEKYMNISRTNPDSIANKIINIIEAENPSLWNPVTEDAFLFALLRKSLPRKIFHELMFISLPGSRNWGGDFAKNQKMLKKAN